MELTEIQRANRAKSNSNLVPFKLGQSGNPKGRPPKDICITSKVKEILDGDAGNGLTYADLVAKVIVDGLVNGTLIKKHGINVPLVREMLDRVEGKVPTPIALSGHEGKEIVFRVILR